MHRVALAASEESVATLTDTRKKEEKESAAGLSLCHPLRRRRRDG